ncbi:MAG: RidA family protein [Flavobacteriales bacterium]|jgi:2-iminobutanoate/2-iminopropanoate deaminase|nr:RidA family protein [Flavobacteriales bacterium]MDG1005958.1 RidA family protein [Schleiferiaceae bacterium]NCF95592.1 RidA family protein [Bacteroidota bacterium]NCG44604.1 RidA family protein [Pseudomonadota bacterium]MBT3572104.1 RidA family protein [Flavobacteriales bacterium]
MAKHHIIYSSKAPPPVGPYSQAIQANGMIYVSGQIAIDPQSGNLCMGSIAEETKQVLENLKAVLEAGGASLNHVVKCSIFLSDMKYYAEVNAVYETYFTDIQPARETVAVAGLPMAVNVEISAIACLTFTTN